MQTEEFRLYVALTLMKGNLPAHFARQSALIHLQEWLSEFQGL